MVSDSSLPLDAEQIVRLTGAVLTRVLNAIRHPEADRAIEGELILALGELAGVPIATREVTYRGFGDAPYKHVVLAPYGYVEPAELSAVTPASGSPQGTGASAPSVARAVQNLGEADA